MRKSIIDTYFGKKAPTGKGLNLQIARFALQHIVVSIWVFPKIDGTPKSSILIGLSSINHPFWGTPIFGNTHIYRFLFSVVYSP